MQQDGRMANPILSSVLYLTGAPEGPNDETEADATAALRQVAGPRRAACSDADVVAGLAACGGGCCLLSVRLPGCPGFQFPCTGASLHAVCLA